MHTPSSAAYVIRFRGSQRHVVIHNTPTRKRTHQAQAIHTSHTSHSLHSHARDVRRIPRSQTRFRVAIPRVNPGSEPRCNHLAWQACGPWRTQRHNTYMQPRRLWQHEGLMIHRSLWKSDDPKYRRHVHGIWIFHRGAGPRPHSSYPCIYLLPVTKCGKMATSIRVEMALEPAGSTPYGRLHYATLNNSTAYAPLGLACLCPSFHALLYP